MGFDISALFNPKARSLFGLDISSSAEKIVELSANGKDGYRVERYAIEVLPKDAVSDGNIDNLDGVVDCAKRAWKRMGTSTKNVAMALPGSAVITKKTIVPDGLREDELEAQVESEANQYLPFSIDEVNLDYQIIGPAPAVPDELEVLIAASKKERVADRVAVADAAGLKAIVIDVESFGTLSAFELIERQLPEGGKNQIVALVDAGANVMNLTVLRNGLQVYAREQAFGGSQLTQDITRHYGMTWEILTILLIPVACIVVFADILNEDGKAGRTGSPGEFGCTGCHTSFPVNTGGGSITISSPNLTNWQYIPGQVYQIDVTVAKTGTPLFGFGFESLRSTGANAGTFTITNSTETQLKSANINGNNRTNVVHKENGG